MASSKKTIKISLSDIFFLLGFLFILVYVLLKIEIFAILVFTFFILSIYFDIKEGVKKSGVFGYLKDFVISVLVIVFFWIASIVILQTSSPYNAVASCSMLPSLERGDAIVLKKVDITKIAPVINVNSSFIQELFLEFKKQEVCAACNETICSLSDIPKNSKFVVYSYKENRVVQPKLNITCGECTKNFLNGSVEKIPCFKFFTIGDKKIFPNKNNSIIVYKTSSYDSMEGEIIHRAVVVLNASNNYFVLTKGDNNPDLDFQYGVAPKNSSSIIGEVIVRFPILGYAKLFLFGQFSQPVGCDFVIKS
jgi:signal peptidase I